MKRKKLLLDATMCGDSWPEKEQKKQRKQKKLREPKNQKSSCSNCICCAELLSLVESEKPERSMYCPKRLLKSRLLLVPSWFCWLEVLICRAVEQGLSFSLCRWGAGLGGMQAKKILLGGVAALGGCDDGGCDDGALWQCYSIAVDADRGRGARARDSEHSLLVVVIIVVVEA